MALVTALAGGGVWMGVLSLLFFAALGGQLPTGWFTGSLGLCVAASILAMAVGGIAFGVFADELESSRKDREVHLPTLPPDALRLLAARLEGGEATCQYCMETVTRGEAVACRRCETVHHADCWEEAGVCTTYACGSTEADPLGDPGSS